MAIPVHRLGQMAHKYLLWICFAMIAWTYARQTVEKQVLDPKSNVALVKMDAIEYYGYLPAILIYHDPGFSFLDRPFPKGHISNFWVKPHPSHRYTTRMTFGYAIIAAPGFLAGHLAAAILGFPQDGFSKPYLISIWIWTNLLLFVAFFHLYHLLLRNGISNTIAASVILMLALGTNLFNYATFETCMTHCFLFFLCTVLLNSTFSYYKKPTFANTFGIVVSLGMMALIRPTDIILILLPLGFGIHRLSQVSDRIKAIAGHWKWLLVAMGIVAIPFVLQLCYWKWATGNWFYDGYEGESFFFGKSHLLSYLFGWRKGWLLYTPIMAVAIAGLFLKPLRNMGYTWPVAIILLPTIWLHSCWWCWWFGGSFGARSMIDFHPILALPIAILLQKTMQLKWVFQLPAIAVFAFILKLNMHQTNQYQGGLLHWDSMTKAAYRAIFMKPAAPENFGSLLQAPDTEKAKRGEE